MYNYFIILLFLKFKLELHSNTIWNKAVDWHFQFYSKWRTILLVVRSQEQCLLNTVSLLSVDEKESAWRGTSSESKLSRRDGMVRTVHMPILGLFVKGLAQFPCGVIPEERDSWDAVCALQGGCLLSCDRLLQHISKYSVLSSVIS